MRLLVVSLRYPPYVAGGYEILARDAVRGLRERGHDVWVLCGRGSALEGEDRVLPLLRPALPEEGDAQNLFELSHRGGNLERMRLHFLRWSNWRATRRALRESGADVLVFFNLGLASLAPLLAARAAGVPTTGFASDGWPMNHWLRDWRASGARTAKAGQLAALEHCWHAYRDSVGMGDFLVSSDFLRERYAADGIPRASMDLLRVPLAPEMLPAEAAPAPRAAGERLRVASASMLWEGKGVHVLLEAAARAVEAGADLELHVAGDGGGAYRDELDRLAASPALEGRVTWRGLLDRGGTAELLASSHVLAFPSVWDEPYPTATLEAMAQCCAVVASDAGGTPEQFTDGETGLVVPAGDEGALARALGRLAADDGLRLGLARAGREAVVRAHAMPLFLDGLEAAAGAALARSVA
jgi:glycosyltransferase involved in cell wall biosynthesis